MPATAANANTEKKAMSAASTQSAHPSPPPLSREPKQPGKYSKARKSLDAFHLLAINTPCTVQSLAGVLFMMVDTYRMPDNIAKSIGYIAEALQHIEQQRLNNEDAKSLPELFKSLQNNLSAEMDKQEQLNSVAKEIGQAVESLKASINDMVNSIAQVTDTSMQLASTAMNYKDTLLKSSEQA
ncbi:hypothetical protein V8E53_014145 [Lactarius tabidus]